MAVRCSAKEVADFILLWGMSGTFPQYCIYAEDALNLKSIDLIISTMGIFVEAFWIKFKGIYQKLKMDFPLSEEKVIEFLKPRCLLLTKDEKYFNFMLVCALVSEIMHSFFQNNKCFHSVKVASKCLAAILDSRFRKVFETDSGWEELMSFCKKMHDLIYPSVKQCKSKGNQIVEVDRSAEREGKEKEGSPMFPATVTTDASFPVISQNLTELSVEKCTFDDNEDFHAKVAGENSSTPLKKDLEIKKEGEKPMGLCNLEFPISACTPQVLEQKDEVSSSVDKEPNSKGDSEKVCAIDMCKTSLFNLLQEIIPISINENHKDTRKLNQISSEENETQSSEKGFAQKTVPEKADLCNLKPISCSSVTLQIKGEVSVQNENMEDSEKILDKSGTRDSLLPELTHDIHMMSIEKKDFNKNAEAVEKPGQIIDSGKKLSLSPENTRESRKFEDFCKLESVSSVDFPQSFHFEDQDSSSKHDSEGSEVPFSIFGLASDQICSRITDDAQHLSDIMNLIKMCEEDIEPNLFTLEELDIPVSDNHYEDLKTSHGANNCPRDSDLTIFDLGIKTVVFATFRNFQKYTDQSVKRIFGKFNPSDEELIYDTSDDESSVESSNGTEFDDDMLNFEEPRCQFCAGSTNKFFDSCVKHFGTHWYSTHHLVTDLFSFKLRDYSE